MKLLIGYDGSECAVAALQDLTRAGLPADGGAIVLCAADIWPQLLQADPSTISPAGGAAGWAPIDFQGARRFAREELTRARQTADRGAERLKSLLPHWRIESEAEGDVPYWAIIRRADVWKPDLVAIGSHGHSAVGRFLLGSVSTAVLTHAQGSVRIARASDRPDAGPIRIMLGLDGSTGSEAAARSIENRRWPAETQVKVVTALDTTVSTALPVGAALALRQARYERAQDWVNDVIERAAARLRGAGLDASTEVREGNPRKVLLEVAEHWHADCIIVGAKGMSSLERFLLGSVSTAVASRATCSVEVVRETSST